MWSARTVNEASTKAVETKLLKPVALFFRKSHVVVGNIISGAFRDPIERSCPWPEVPASGGRSLRYEWRKSDLKLPHERLRLNVSSGRYRVNGLPHSPARLQIAIYAASARQQTIGRRRHVPRPTARTEGGKHSECISCYEGFKSQACTGFFLSRCLAGRMEMTGQEGASICRSGCAKCHGDIAALHLT